MITYRLMKSPKSCGSPSETKWDIVFNKRKNCNGFIEKIWEDTLREFVWCIQWQYADCNYQLGTIGVFDFERKENEDRIRKAEQYDELGKILLKAVL